MNPKINTRKKRRLFTIKTQKQTNLKNTQAIYYLYPQSFSSQNKIQLFTKKNHMGSLKQKESARGRRGERPVLYLVLSVREAVKIQLYKWACRWSHNLRFLQCLLHNEAIVSCLHSAIPPSLSVLSGCMFYLF